MSKKVNLKNFFQSILKEKSMTMTDLADNVCKSQGNISNIIGSGSMNFKTFETIMEGMGEEVVIVLKNGNKYTLTAK